MTSDAKFADGAVAPLRLLAFDADDLAVISSLVQDAVLTVADMSFRGGQFGLLLSRIRREEALAAPERVRAALIFDHVQNVRSSGFGAGDRDLVVSLLAVSFAPEAAELRLIFSGDGEIVLEVEALEALLRDVARPHGAVSGKLPRHPD